MSSTDVRYDEEISMARSTINYPLYKQLRLVPNSGTSTVTLNETSQQEITFDIPAVVFNMAQSSLNFVVTITQAGALLPAMHTLGVAPIERMSLYTRSGLYLVDIPNFANYTHSVMPLHTPIDKKNSHGAIGVAAAAGTSEGLACGINPTYYVSNLDSAAIPTDTYDTTTGAAQRPAGNPSIDGIQHIAFGTAAAGLQVQYNIPFELLYGTLMCVNKDVYFGSEILNLRIQFGGHNTFALACTAATSVSAGAIPIGSGADAGTVVVTNPHLLLAVEQSLPIKATLTSRVASAGYSLMVPFLYGFQNTLTANSTTSVQYRLNRGHGVNLMRVMSAVYNLDNVPAGVLNAWNNSGEKYSDLFTSLDNTRIQDSNMSTAAHDTYRYMRRMLEGSSVTGAGSLESNNMYVDSFNNSKMIDVVSRDMALGGVELDTERLYGATYTLGNNGNKTLYTWAIVQRELRVQANLISWG
jgi:hypothetical protein